MNIPVELCVVGPSSAAAMLDISKSHFMQKVACRPDFPARCNPQGMSPRWMVKDIYEWLERNKQRRAG